MTTPSGQISLNDVNVELGLAGTTLISMNQSNVRTLAGVGGSGTQISMQNLQGKSNRVTASITIASNTTNYTLNPAKVTGYVAGKTDVTLTINSGVYVYSGSTGSYAFSVSGWTSGDTVSVINNGVIIGRGGDGGEGGWSVGKDLTGGANGGAAGPAFYTNFATTVTNNNRISGGGGGGGGGGWFRQNNMIFPGPGGAGGIGNSSGGYGRGWGKYSGVGTGGTLTATGSPGESIGVIGGTGGSYGSAGGPGTLRPGAYGYMWTPNGSGGAAGAAVVGNSNITWLATGTRNGSIS